MTIARVGATVTGGGGGATVVVTKNGVTALNFLGIMGSCVDTGTTPPTYTDSNGTVQTAIAPALIKPGANSVGAQIVYVESTASGTHTITCTPVSNAWTNVSVTEYSGVLASSSFDKSASATATTPQTVTSGTTPTTSQADELSLVALAELSGAGVADFLGTDPPAGYTSLMYDGATNTQTGTEHAFQVLSSTGAQSVTWSWTDGTTQASMGVIATFKAAPTGGPVDYPIEGDLYH